MCQSIGTEDGHGAGQAREADHGRRLPAWARLRRRSARRPRGPTDLLRRPRNAAVPRGQGTAPARARRLALRVHPHRRSFEGAQIRAAPPGADLLRRLGPTGRRRAAGGHAPFRRRAEPARALGGEGAEGGQVAMEHTLVLSAFKASVVLLCALIAVQLLRRASAAARHLVLCVAVVAALVMPVVSAVVPALRIEIPGWIATVPSP